MKTECLKLKTGFDVGFICYDQHAFMLAPDHDWRAYNRKDYYRSFDNADLEAFLPHALAAL